MKIFLLGDSRTGTTSVHEYLLRCGIPSLHYYVAEAGLAEPLHRHRAANWPKLRQFIDGAPYRAFSDYPTRIFHAELRAAYPDAFYILTLRRDLAVWRRSMEVLLGPAGGDLELLQAYYLCYNEEIRSGCRELGRRYLELVIEDDAGVNASRISNFLGVPTVAPLRVLNNAAELVAARAK